MENSSAATLKKPSWGLAIFGVAAGLIVIAFMIWQAVVSQGAPDPTHSRNPQVAMLNIAVLVFREGLESILVLAAITASMTGAKSFHRRPVAVGAAIGFIAAIATWFLAVRFIDDLMEYVPALHVQAATGLLAVIVLLIVMNWFFHNVYWGGWISMHNKRKRALTHGAHADEISHRSLLIGLATLGFASVYREGVEIVLFLQSYRMKMGGGVVLGGALIGLFLSGIVAILTFIAHQKLPYRKMLVLTGILLGGVLLIMVGEQAQEMQLAHWLPTTKIESLEGILKPWMGMWFALFPTVETLVAQALALLLVVGSYFAAERMAAKPGALRPHEV